MANQYDVIVLGTGNAGMGAAGITRAAGKTVAMVESWDVGGTCPLRGCVPKKVLVAAAQVLHQIELAPVHHIHVDNVQLDLSKLIDRERTFVDGVPDEFASSLENRGIDLLKGKARFVGRNQIAVDDQILTAGKIVIATGSKTRPLSILGAAHMITSDEILEMDTLPESLIFIGGGVIALEFSNVFARAGTKVTILEAMPQLLPRLDSDAVALIHEEAERLGIIILTDVKVEGVDDSKETLTVSFEHQGDSKTLSATKVANGTGRIPNLDGLDLNTGEVEHDGTRITVDKYLRSTSNLDVYVAGDALWSSAQLSPVATYEGKIVGENIVNDANVAPEYYFIPSSVFTIPALASVGLTEAEASSKGLAFTVKTNDMGAWRSSKTHAETVAFAKVLVEDNSGNILGAHMVGHGAEEVIHLFAFAMKHGITSTELANTVFAYPTFASDIKFLV